MSWTGTVYCSYCGNKGHNRRGCPTMKQQAAEDPGSYAATEVNRRKEREKLRGPRKCSYCEWTGHNRTTCTIRKDDIINVKLVNKEYRKRVSAYMASNGIGIGALVRFNSWNGDNKVGLVTALRLRLVSVENNWDAYTGDFVEATPAGAKNAFPLRLPQDCEEVEENQWGREQIKDVLSPIDSNTVTGQIPEEWEDELPGVTWEDGFFSQKDGRNYMFMSKVAKLSDKYGLSLTFEGIQKSE